MQVITALRSTCTKLAPGYIKKFLRQKETFGSKVALKETSQQPQILVSVLIEMSVLNAIESGEECPSIDGENQAWAYKR